MTRPAGGGPFARPDCAQEKASSGLRLFAQSRDQGFNLATFFIDTVLIHARSSLEKDICPHHVPVLLHDLSPQIDSSPFQCFVLA